MAGPVPDPGGFIRGRVLIAAVLLWPLIIHTAIADTDVGDRNNGFSVADEKYLSKYEAAHKAGFDVGRNLLDSAWSDAEPVSDERIEASTATLERWLNPPEVSETAESFSSESTYSTDASYVAPSSGGGYAIPESIVMCESGGDYSASNPSGAYGAYQIMPSTAAGYGCDLSTAAGQDQCAAEIYAAEGSAPWDCG